MRIRRDRACRKYETVDEMIPKFELDEDEEITNPFFEVVKGLFKSKSKPNQAGWIETFVGENNLESLLNNEENAASDYSSVFINFNYDTLLLSRIVQYFKNKYQNASKLERRQWKLNYGEGSDFAAKFQGCAQAIYHPLGILYLCDGDETKINPKASRHSISKTYRNAFASGGRLRPNNITSGRDNAISCHDAMEQFTFTDIREQISRLAGEGRRDVEMRLIFLGVGPDSLELNLKWIFKEETFNVTQIDYTCIRDADKRAYEQYFKRFDATTERYKDCQELVDKNTFIPQFENS